MSIQKIAVPSNAPGGLEGERSDHFGHCDLFTIVTVDDRQITEVTTVTNAPHGAGGCLTPIGVLQEHQVNAIVVAGMGKRPLNGFLEAGITVYWAPLALKKGIKEAVDGVMNNELQTMAATQACTGSGNCHGEGHQH